MESRDVSDKCISLSDCGSVTQIESHTYMFALHDVTHHVRITHWSVLSTSWGGHRLRRMLQGRETMDKFQRQFSLCNLPVFLRKRFVAGTSFCPRNILHKFQRVWIFCVLKQVTKSPQFSMSHRVHRSCKMYPLQDICVPWSPSCSPACVLTF